MFNVELKGTFVSLNSSNHSAYRLSKIVFKKNQIVLLPTPPLPFQNKILLDFATFAVCPSVKIDRSVDLTHSGNCSLIKTVLSPEGKGTIKVCLLAIKIKWKYQSLNCGKYRALVVGSFAVYIY